MKTKRLTLRQLLKLQHPEMRRFGLLRLAQDRVLREALKWGNLPIIEGWMRPGEHDALERAVRAYAKLLGKSAKKGSNA
jgi:hypothetical protein